MFTGQLVHRYMSGLCCTFQSMTHFQCKHQITK